MSVPIKIAHKGMDSVPDGCPFDLIQVDVLRQSNCFPGIGFLAGIHGFCEICELCGG